MPGESDSRSNQNARSGSSSSHHVVDVESSDGRSRGSADKISFCIFRVPQSLSHIDQMAYRPSTVPIGPYHHQNPEFEKIQEHKWRFFIDLLNRSHQGMEKLQTEKLKMEKLQQFATALKPMEEKIRKCYPEALAFNSDELIQMMVLDACFIVELFCKYSRRIIGYGGVRHDPLLTEPWVFLSLMLDLAKLENQIPWFVLKRLFDLTLGSSNESDPSLSDLALSFFNRKLQRPNDVLMRYSNSEGEHLLDFLRLTFIPYSPETKREQNKFRRLIQPANKLHQAGIKFKPTHCESFMDIKFSNGVLEIPVLSFDDFLRSLFLNFISFEQCHRDSSKHVTTYATFMACLLNTPADAEFLCNRKIIERYFSTDDQIAHFFSNVGKHVLFDIRKNHLAQVFWDVNRSCEEDLRVPLHGHWTSFKETYFKSRWYLISAIAAFILLVLSAIQSSYAVIAYYRPHK